MTIHSPKKRQSKWHLAAMALALVAVLYVLLAKWIPGDAVLDNDTAPRVSDSLAAENREITRPDTPVVKMPKYRLPAYRGLEPKYRYAIRRIDSAMGQAGRLAANDPSRNTLLEQVLMAIDSALLGSDNPYFLINKGDVLLMLDQPIAAEGYYRLALAQLPHVEALRRNHAKACVDGAYKAVAQGDSDRAIQLLDRYVHTNDTNTKAINLLVDWSLRRGVGLLRAHHDARGLRTLRRAWVLRPQHYMVQLNLGIAHYRLQGFDSAIYHFTHCAQANPKDRAPTDYLYIIYTRQGNHREADRYAPG